jgi:outer membrane immunogenic protein
MTSPRRRSLDCAGARRRAAALLFAAVGVLLLVPAARAADLDDALRGSFSSPVNSPSYFRWDGFNIGAQFGLSQMHTDFGGSTGNQVAYILRNTTIENEAQPSSWTSLPAKTSDGRSFGAFIGYNIQMDQLVLGVDAAYNSVSSLQSSASDSMTRIVTTSDSVTHTITISSASSMQLIDYATFRARAGYAFGQFLPYAFVGGAVGRYNATSSATVTDHQVQGATTINFGPVTQSDNRNNAVTGGFTTGLGLDVAILPNVYLRAEWEFVGFAQVNGIRSTMNTGRVGLGVKF